MSAVDKRRVLADEVFSYFATKDGKVFIHWHAKPVKTLSGQAAQSFLGKIAGLNPLEAQLVMAKLTGNFKRGNEKRGAD
jgi:hypothetical protein